MFSLFIHGVLGIRNFVTKKMKEQSISLFKIFIDRIDRKRFYRSKAHPLTDKIRPCNSASSQSVSWFKVSRYK